MRVFTTITSKYTTGRISPTPRFAMGLRMDLTFLLSILTVFVSGVCGQQYDPSADFCRRFSHDAAVIGDRLYINDGQLNLQGNGGKNFTNDRLLFHDLTTTTLGGQNHDMPILVNNLTKPSYVPSVIGGVLWADQANGRLFQYGGEWTGTSVLEDRFLLWTYDVYGNSWSSRDVNRDIIRLSFGAGTAVEQLGKGYYLGGWMSSHSDMDWVGPRKASNKLVEYDMVLDQWKNNTGPADQMGRAEGVQFYVPFGDGGMLLHFGGVRTAENNQTQEQASMATIDIYDVANGNWYTQTATGDIPNPRRRFCGGVANAQDGSSSNIYIYGGLGFGANATGYDDVYILTIPTFTWIQIFPSKGIPRQEKDTNPHYDLTCNVVKNAQLLIIGGQFPKDPDATKCDTPDKWGVHNLVMSKSNKGTESVYWDVFDPKRDTYTVPDDVIKVIGGDAQGHAQVRSPNPKFDYADLEVLFRRTVPVQTRAPTRAAPAPAATSTSASSHSPPSSGVFSTPAKRAAILVPIICGTVLLAVLAFLLIRRHQNHKRHPLKPDLGPPLYESQDSAVAVPLTESIPTTPYSSTAPAGWPRNPPSLPPPPQIPQQYMALDPPPMGYPGMAYSEYTVSSQSHIMSPPPPIPQLPAELPQHGGWSPEPVPGYVPGHYPPPLDEGMAEVRHSMPEMKERRREGDESWPGFGAE